MFLPSAASVINESTSTASLKVLINRVVAKRKKKKSTRKAGVVDVEVDFEVEAEDEGKKGEKKAEIARRKS